MTSAVRTHRAAKPTGTGFTLLEIVIVLAIIMVLAGGAVGYMVYNSATRRMQRAAGEVEMMAKRARALAILGQTPYSLVFCDGRVRMMPLAEVGVEDPEHLEELRAIATEEGRPVPIHAEFQAENGMVLGLRRWGRDEWLVFDDERTLMVWRFDPDGLCEPVSLRFEVDDGKSWLEQEYHPLTAAARDSEMVAR